VSNSFDRINAGRSNVLTQTRNQILNDGFKGLILVNGGGAAALAAFLQAIWDKPDAAAMRTYLLIGIASLLLGTAMGAILFLARYLSFFHRNTNILTRNPWWWTTILLILFSLGCFLFGMGAAVYGGFITLPYSYAKAVTGGGIMGMDSTLRFFSISGSVSDMVVAIIAIFAAIFAYRAWRVSKGQLKSQIISDILREYRSAEMGNAIRRLHEEFEQCGKDASKLIESYEKKYDSEKHCRESLHHQRRIVSNFYQHVSALISNGIIENTVFYSLWTKENLKIIPEILLPIERIAIPHVTHKPEMSIENLPVSMKNMLEFFDKKAPDS
jgi:hypothetical protein